MITRHGTALHPSRPSIAIVVTYFGPPPLWLPAFLLSCRRNPDVRWIIYTDVQVAADIPPNVTFAPMDIAELDRRASAVLGTNIGLPRSLRKICDLKPTYGLLFADDLKPVDFWAHSDLDIVWGDVRRFLSDDILDRHDIVSSRKGRLSGHFTLFRNTAAINRTFELIPDVRTALAAPKHAHLDETAMTICLRELLAGPTGHAAPRVCWRQALTMSADYQRALGDGPSDNLWWRDGKTFDAEGRELMYLHFHKMKRDMDGINFGYGDSPAAFAINRKGFFA
ncbi:MAG: hypothetical protein HY657_18155 [Acidobacteria bacterium]|nr:hypothetical protein [Acidobacteriota bacterium]